MKEKLQNNAAQSSETAQENPGMASDCIDAEEQLTGLSPHGDFKNAGPEASEAPSEPEPLVTWAAELSYDGTPFAGFAKQPDLFTVQGELEKALEIVFRRPIETVCAGRTDAGVHARGQWISFQLTQQEASSKGTRALTRSMNALTHSAISIRRIEERPLDFSARFDARTREYRYFIAASDYCPVLLRNTCWHAKYPLNVEAMRQACAYLIGEHDFKSFCLAASAEGKNTVRTVMELSVDPTEVMGEELICIRIVGSAFLHSMVRTIVGTLVLIGRGKREPQWMEEVLNARCRDAAGEKAPACGLVFWHVDYDDTAHLSAKERMSLLKAAESCSESAPASQTNQADGGKGTGESDAKASGKDDEKIAEANLSEGESSLSQQEIDDLAAKLDDNAKPHGSMRKNTVLSAQQLPASKKDGFAEAERIRDVEMPSVLDSLDFSAFDTVLQQIEGQIDEALKSANRVTDPTDFQTPADDASSRVESPSDGPFCKGTATRKAQVLADPVPIQQRDSYMAPANPKPSQEEDFLAFENRAAAAPAAKKDRRHRSLFDRIMGTKNNGESEE